MTKLRIFIVGVVIILTGIALTFYVMLLHMGSIG